MRILEVAGVITNVAVYSLVSPLVRELPFLWQVLARLSPACRMAPLGPRPKLTPACARGPSPRPNCRRPAPCAPTDHQVVYVGGAVLGVYALKVVIAVLVPDVPDSVRVAVAKERWRMEEMMKFDEKRLAAEAAGVSVEALDKGEREQPLSSDSDDEAIFPPSPQPLRRGSIGRRGGFRAAALGVTQAASFGKAGARTPSTNARRE